MLAEEDALEAGRLGACPQIEIGIEIARRLRSIELLVEFDGRAEELEDPGFYHGRGSPSDWSTIGPPS